MNHCRLFNTQSSLYIYIYIYIYMIWFGCVLWYINHCSLFKTKSSLNIHIRYTWFGLVGFYGISAMVAYLMFNPLYTYILNIYDYIWLGFMVHQICRLYNTKFSVYIYIEYTWFSLVVFYGTNTIIGYSMLNPLYTYILNIYDLV